MFLIYFSVTWEPRWWGLCLSAHISRAYCQPDWEQKQLNIKKGEHFLRAWGFILGSSPELQAEALLTPPPACVRKPRASDFNLCNRGVLLCALKNFCVAAHKLVVDRFSGRQTHKSCSRRAFNSSPVFAGLNKTLPHLLLVNNSWSKQSSQPVQKHLAGDIWRT